VHRPNPHHPNPVDTLDIAAVGGGEFIAPLTAIGGE
jgi:hypothetical protein